MKIVHVVHRLEKGGAERVAAELASHAAQQGHDVQLVLAEPTDPRLLQDELAPEVRVFFVSERPTTRTMRHVRILPWVMRNWNLFEDCDVVHCHMTYGSLVGSTLKALRQLRRASRPRFIMETYHAVGMNIPQRRRLLHASLLKQKDACVLMAKDGFWQDFLEKNPGLPAAVIPNGVKPPKTVSNQAIDDFRAIHLAGTEDKLVVGTVGMFRRDRKPWIFIPIFARIVEEFGHGVEFLMAGAGQEMARVSQLACEYGIRDKLRLPGLVSPPQVAFNNIDVYVTLNVGSLTGVATMEACLAGCPVTAYQLDPNYRTSNEDWIWSSADETRLAQRIVRLLRMQPEREALAQRQLSYVEEHHSLEAMALAYYQFYDHLHALDRKNGFDSRGP